MLRWVGGAAGIAGAATIAAWAATAGQRPSAIVDGLAVPFAGLGLVIAGLLVWMWGMARNERAQALAWAWTGALVAEARCRLGADRRAAPRLDDAVSAAPAAFRARRAFRARAVPALGALAASMRAAVPGDMGSPPRRTPVVGAHSRRRPARVPAPGLTAVDPRSGLEGERPAVLAPATAAGRIRTTRATA